MMSSLSMQRHSGLQLYRPALGSQASPHRPGDRPRRGGQIGAIGRRRLLDVKRHETPAAARSSFSRQLRWRSLSVVSFKAADAFE